MIATTNIAGLLRFAYHELLETDQNPELDAQVLLSHLLNKPRSWLFAHPEYCPDPQIVLDFQDCLAKLQDGYPLSYLTGKREFYGLSFQVTNDVLVPRPETELLVEHAIGWLKHHPQVTDAIDIGTGSGCIAAALAKNCPQLSIIAVDISPKALQVAVRNFEDHGVEPKVHPVCSDLCSCLSGTFHLVCANLPYIPSFELSSLSVSRFEPHLALDGGRNGLDKIHRLLIDSSRWFVSPGLMLLEIHEIYGYEVQTLAANHYPSANIDIINDYADRSRLVRIEI